MTTGASDASATDNAPEVWTIGHWTCPEPDFLRPLHENGIEVLADVRAHPGSRRNPQFGRDEMPGWLADAGLAYIHFGELGGRRPKQPQVDPELNAGWSQPSFKNYADYTQTANYRDGIARLTSLARIRRLVIMCGEPMPWRCHRLLISNTLAARGWVVWHLMGDDPPRRHVLGRWGALPVIGDGFVLTYPPQHEPTAAAQ
ncbi:DUF488 family protein [Microlunatus sp. Gsoil 973]|uniref:DUF488 domain-containing protein n=1 Tax=Microlunatus sp. Gsoil 973 TaxID=2672569 RepID=UPI0012B46BE1|nr:DUF488 domain-containing protein [Microlunatus sp. Gsoil 973]QGN34362.1 DUF488 family protein [Microlunatus sp. Gsoil 973]